MRFFLKIEINQKLIKYFWKIYYKFNKDLS